MIMDNNWWAKVTNSNKNQILPAVPVAASPDNPS